MHKTGSSSVQHNLAGIKNPDGWCLFSVGGRSNMGPALFAMFNPAPHNYQWFARGGDTPEEVAAKGARWREELREGIMAVKDGTFIISAEGLSNFSMEDVISLREFLLPLCDEIRVIGYVRPPVAFKISRFQENVKQGHSEFNVAKIRLNYRGKFKKFDRIFGKENVILRKFDPASFPNQCLVADFCQQIGIKFPEDTPVRRINESLSREACGMVYAYRKFGPGFGVGKNVIKENMRLIKPFLAMRGAKFDVSRSILNAALEHERKDIEWMEKRLGVSLGEVDKGGNSAITSEDDLLTITRKSCEEYAERFKVLYGVELPLDAIPQGEMVDPVQVANLVEISREICRRIIQEKELKNASRIRRSSDKTLLQRVRRFPAVTMRVLARLVGLEAR